MKAKSLYPFLATSALLLVTGVVMAQFPGGGSPPPGGAPSCWPPPCIPIDGGIGFLIAAGIAVGGKKLLNLRK
jgi:hypothetical protein